MSLYDTDMAHKLIPNPFIVEWYYDNNDIIDIGVWCRENITSQFYIICLGQKSSINNAGVVVELRTDEDRGEEEWEIVEQKNGSLCLFLFESPKDALLFKMTWGGNNNDKRKD